MNLRRVTFTGVDDTTDLNTLVALNEQYPFAEWAMMVSTTHTGLAPRFPSLTTLEKIADLNIQKAVHLNDSLARCAAEDTGYPMETALQLVRGAKRIQINLFQEIDRYPEIFHKIQHKAITLSVQVVLQTYGFDIPAVATAHNSTSRGSVVFLHDSSGGRGIAGDFEQPINGDFVGFAGGIRAENVLAKLEQIQALDFASPFWIDIESSVRTDDVFDLNKVERLLRLVEPFVQTD